MKDLNKEYLIVKLNEVLNLIEDGGFDSWDFDDEGMYQDIQDMLNDLTS